MRSSTLIAWVSRIVLAALAVFGTARMAPAQSATTDWAKDRPSQRWLPLPQAERASDPYQLAERLRQIRSLVTRDGTKDSLPKLSEEQLRQLDDVARQWQDKFGDVPLPSWDSIPKELIDSALADPEQRRQAQRLLEQYARQRRLPATGPGLELPRNPDGSDAPASTPSDVTAASPSTATTFDQAHEQLPPEHDRELQELLSELRAIETAQRASRAASTDAQADSSLKSGRLRDARSKAAAANDGGSTSGSNQRPNTGLRDAPSPATNAQAARRAQQLAPGARGQSSQPPRGTVPTQRPNEGAEIGADGSKRSLSGSLVEQNSGTQAADIRRPRANNSPGEPDASNGANSQAANAAGADRPETSARAPADDENPFDLPKDPMTVAGRISSGNLNGDRNEAMDSFNGANAPALRGEPRSGPDSSGPDSSGPDSSGLDNSKQSRLQAPAAPPDGSASTSSGAGSQDALQQEVRKQIERFGLGSALRRIAAKAFKEQIADARKSVDASTNSPSTGTPQRTGANASSNATANTNNRASPNTAPSGAPQTERSSTGSDSSMATWAKGWSSAIGDVLRSLATVPGASREAGAPSSAAGTARAWKPELSWHGRGIETFVAVILIGLLCVALLSMRRRLAVTSSVRASERSWAKEILAEGIRTRADVVRAFHRLVLRTTQPVAAWWTHRYAAKRLSESRPQLSEAMQELSSAYEQARYMPPDADLSDEQLKRVRAALQQCAAYRVSNAST